MATFIVEIDSPLSRDEVRREVLIRFSIPLGNATTAIESQNEVVITYARRHRPYYIPAILLFWLVFPLLLLLIERTDRVMFTFLDRDEGTHILVVGEDRAACAVSSSSWASLARSKSSPTGSRPTRTARAGRRRSGGEGERAVGGSSPWRGVRCPRRSRERALSSAPERAASTEVRDEIGTKFRLPRSASERKNPA